MKKINILFISALTLTAAAFTSCKEEQELPPVAYPDGGSVETIGTGQWDDPYSVWQVLAGVDNGSNKVWMTGYIVGYINTFDGDYAKLREKSAVFSAVGAPNSNLLVADNPDETNWERCVPVQLEYNTDGRDLSLGYHPEYLGRQVTLYGTTGANYLSVYGLRNCSAYEWGDQGTYIAPPDVFQKTTEIQDGGQYVLVASNKYIAKPVGETNSYGWLYVAEGNASQTLETDLSYAFAFYREGDYWIIKDSFGRYVYQIANSNNFQVGLEKPTQNYLWDVKFDENGLATITNVDRKTWIQFDANYSSYGCYSDQRGVLPAMYVLVSNEE